MDAGAEINKLEKKTEIAQSNKDKLRKTMGQANYESTVREDVRAANVDKVSWGVDGVKEESVGAAS